MGDGHRHSHSAPAGRHSGDTCRTVSPLRGLDSWRRLCSHGLRHGLASFVPPGLQTPFFSFRRDFEHHSSRPAGNTLQLLRPPLGDGRYATWHARPDRLLAARVKARKLLNCRAFAWQTGGRARDLSFAPKSCYNHMCVNGNDTTRQDRTTWADVRYAVTIDFRSGGTIAAHGPEFATRRLSNSVRAIRPATTRPQSSRPDKPRSNCWCP